jgi:hypothetical protein
MTVKFQKRWFCPWVYIHYIAFVFMRNIHNENAEEDKQKCLSRHTNNSPPPICAGILKQSMGDRNRVGEWLSYRHAKTRICKLLRSPELVVLVDFVFPWGLEYPVVFLPQGLFTLWCLQMA